MSPVTPDALHAALETVIDPEIRKPVTELGMVESVSADEFGHVAVTILLTVAACPLKDTLTKDTTAVAGSTLVTPAVESTVTRIVSPLAGEIDSTRAGRSRSGRGSSF